MWLNEYDVEEAARKGAYEVERPNLRRATEVLLELVEWTNSNSDGWPYWQKPSKASAKLQELVHARYFGAWNARQDADITDAELKAALTPIKAFHTRMKTGVKV